MATNGPPQRGVLSCPSSLPPSLQQLNLRWYSKAQLTPTHNTTKRTPNASRFINLAPAGTGTESLFVGLTRAAPKAGLWHHRHHTRIGDNPSISSFIITLRDPAARLVSGYRLQRIQHELNTLFRIPSLSVLNTTADFVEALRNASALGHASAQRNYWSSVAWPTTDRHGLNIGLAGGNAFLVSQLDFLRGFNPARHQLKVVCTERFAEDMARVLDALGIRGRNKNNAAILHRHDRSHASSRSRGEEEDGQALSEADAEFVRWCLFPWDTRLHQMLCAPTPIRQRATLVQAAPI